MQCGEKRWFIYNMRWTFWFLKKKSSITSCVPESIIQNMESEGLRAAGCFKSLFFISWEKKKKDRQILRAGPKDARVWEFAFSFPGSCHRKRPQSKLGETNGDERRENWDISGSGCVRSAVRHTASEEQGLGVVWGVGVV